ncbi:MAG: histidine phosphatase family protein [Deltaproteobacteria bacterium]|nr:histidine phosphatase family protein [Deltaproteobacteria bacterium]
MSEQRWVLLMRHGDAVDDAPGMGDRGRWLTQEGRTQTRAVAEQLALRHPRPERLWTSPLVRAVQTAELVAQVLGHTDEVQALAALSVDGNPALVHQALCRVSASSSGLVPSVMVFGHEPTLSALASLMLGPGAWRGFRKSAILALALDAQSGRGTLRYVIEPEA